MIKDHAVIAWTPYGREETVSVLGRYVLREHDAGRVDEWWLCLNTDPTQTRDVAFAYELAAAYQWIKLVQRDAHQPRREPKQRNTGYFYTNFTDPDTIYLRLDDDIVYLHPDAVERLVVHRIEHAQGVASFPVMWNNAVVSWFLQQAGAIPEPGERTRHGMDYDDDGLPEEYVWPRVGGPYCMDPVGWSDSRFAVALHRLLLERIAKGVESLCYLYQDFQLPLGQQYSVGTFTSSGKLYAGLERPGVLVPDEEEGWHTVHQPRAMGEPNVLVGDALVAHYKFFPQKSVRRTDVLEQYAELARQL